MADHPVLRLPPRAPDGVVHVVVETPMGSVHKLSFDDERGVFRLKKSLPLGMAFPYDFGFVPGTLAEDGDPIDVVLLLDGPTPPGVLVETRLIGAIEAEQRVDGEVQRNDRLVGVGVRSRRYGHVEELRDLPRAVVDDLTRFFAAYNVALGKDFRALGTVDARRAGALLDDAIARHPAAENRSS